MYLWRRSWKGQISLWNDRLVQLNCVRIDLFLVAENSRVLLCRKSVRSTKACSLIREKSKVKEVAVIDRLLFVRNWNCSLWCFETLVDLNLFQLLMSVAIRTNRKFYYDVRMSLIHSACDNIFHYSATHVVVITTSHSSHSQCFHCVIV